LSVTLTLLLGFLLSGVPLVWLLRQRGDHRQRDGGTIDGVLLLGSLLLAGFALVMASVALTRSVRDRRIEAASRPLPVRIESCSVVDQRTGGPDATRSAELRCDVAFQAGTTFVRQTLRAGYPSTRQPYDDWMTEHPAGSTITLWQDTRHPTSISGFDRIVPATTTAAHAARRSLLFGVTSCVLFALSRMVVHARRHA
jgi:hypothetical protein